MWVVFFWLEMCTYTAVGDVFLMVNRDVVFWDENDGVRAMDCIGNTLCQSAKFLPKRFLPDGAVLGVLNEVSVFHEFACVLIKNSGCSTLNSDGQ